MGICLNPGNSGFSDIRRDVYVDKTGLIAYVNNLIGKPKPLVCFSRPRRFGKTYDTHMLTAYYDKSCDSRSLFADLEIAGDDSFETYLNKYNVISIDVTTFISASKDTGRNPLEELKYSVLEEIRQSFQECALEGENNLGMALCDVVDAGNARFVFIIDEWDAIFREYKNDTRLQEDYILFLRGLFKSKDVTPKVVAAAYMTGILPVKKYGTESALSDFKEYSMVEPLDLVEYIGFTEGEVRKLCERYNADFDLIKQWYDGYKFADLESVYNPNSVMQAVRYKKIRNYWTQSETYDSLKSYIGLNYDGLKDAIISMLGGGRIRIETGSFQNDITSFIDKDDVLTLLIHFGYLGYDETGQEVYIPNQEIADVFAVTIKRNEWKDVGDLIRESDELLDATLRGDTEAVAAALEKAHAVNSSILQYNSEASLSCAITIAYYTARRYYNIFRELPTGKGFADIVFIPRKGTDKSAMIIELKYDKDADTAIRQIHENRYEGDLKEHFGNLLLVGINYDRDAKGENAKRHSCVIERA